MIKGDKGEGMIGITVTRLGSDPIAVVLKDGGTVREALEKAGVTTTGRMEFFVSGERAEMADILQDRDVLNIVTPKQAGA